MFNAFQFDKQRLNRSNIDEAVLKQQRATAKLKQRNHKLSKQYYMRVEKFVDNLVASNEQADKLRLNTVEPRNRNESNELHNKQRSIDGHTRYNSFNEATKTRFRTINQNSIEVMDREQHQIPTLTSEDKAKPDGEQVIHDTTSLLSDYNETARKDRINILLSKQNKHLQKIQVKFSEANSCIGIKPVKSTDAALRNSKGFRFRPSQKQRVQDSQNQNAILDGSPTRLFQGYTKEQILNLRPREHVKELAGDFKFRARSSLENVVDTFRY